MTKPRVLKRIKRKRTEFDDMHTKDGSRVRVWHSVDYRGRICIDVRTDYCCRMTKRQARQLSRRLLILAEEATDAD